MSRRKVTIVERKLRGNIVGKCWPDGTIELDPRQLPKDFLATAIHECLHEAYPDLTEAEVIIGERIVARVLWKLGYRRMML